jgi:ribosomal protein S18 acetylase RimI-like enzyme
LFDLNTVCIREAKLSDLSALEWDGEYTHFRNIYRRALREAEQGHRILLVAELKGKLIGQIFIHLSHDGCDYGRQSSAHLYSFRVRNMYRNHGVGTNLLAEAEGVLCKRGYTRATISVAKDNQRARRMYERNGYSICGEDEGEWSFLDHQGSLRTIREPSYILEKALMIKTTSR